MIVVAPASRYRQASAAELWSDIRTAHSAFPVDDAVTSLRASSGPKAPCCPSIKITSAPELAANSSHAVGVDDVIQRTNLVRDAIMVLLCETYCRENNWILRAMSAGETVWIWHLSSNSESCLQCLTRKHQLLARDGSFCVPCCQRGHASGTYHGTGLYSTMDHAPCTCTIQSESQFMFSNKSCHWKVSMCGF